MSLIRAERLVYAACGCGFITGCKVNYSTLSLQFVKSGDSCILVLLLDVPDIVLMLLYALKALHI